MLTEVQGKPVRGIISDVAFNRERGNCSAILASEDFLQGTPGRHELVQGRDMTTSKVVGIDVIEGQLVLVTKYSAYIVEGQIQIWEVIVEEAIRNMNKDKPLSLSKSVSGTKDTDEDA